MDEKLKQAIKEVIEEMDLTKPETKNVNIQILANPEDKLLGAPRGEWRNFSDFALDVVRAGANNRVSERLEKWHTAAMSVEGTELRAATAGHMEESELATGGYLVPEEFRAQINVIALESSIVPSRATTIPMQTNRVAIPVVDVSTHVGSYFGGVTIYRPDEAGSITASRPKLGRVALTLHRLTGLVYVTDEILEDSPISLEPLLTNMFGQAVGFVSDLDYIRGDGSNEALGAVNAANPAIISVTRTTSSEINWDDIVNMWARLHPSCHAKAIWLAAPNCFPQLATMSMPVGTGGVPVWLPANGAAAAPFGTLMGKTLMLTEKMNTMGTTPDIALVDFSQYWIGEKSGGNLKTAASIHVSFTTAETAFRFVMRYDGRPSWLNTLTPANSGDTLSPFVTLAT